MPVEKVPKVEVKVESTQLEVFETASVTFSAYHEPSRFQVKIPLSEELQQTLISTKSPKVTIIVNDKPFFKGVIDEAEGNIDDESGERSLHISGQDQSKLMFHTPITESIKSMTASEWITKIAKSHGLTPQVSEKSMQIGALVEANQSSLSNQQKESDLLAEISTWNDYVAYVDLDTLYWGPAPAPSKHMPWTLGEDFNIVTWRKNYEAEQTRVEVSSWNPRNKKDIKHVLAKAGEGQYLIRINQSGLTAKQAQQVADTRHKQAELSALTVSLHNLPGNMDLKRLEWTFSLFSVGKGASQKFYPTSVTHRFSPDEHVMDVEGFNSVEAQK